MLFVLLEGIWFASLKVLGIFTGQISTSLKITDLFFFLISHFLFCYKLMVSCFLFCYKLMVVAFWSEYFQYFFPGKIGDRGLF